LTPLEEAYTELTRAIDKVGRLLDQEDGQLRDDQMVGSYIVVVNCVTMEQTRPSSYLMMTSGGYLPAHEQAGLIQVAGSILDDVWLRSDNDDDD
jgi:hypothetical protein